MSEDPNALPNQPGKAQPGPQSGDAPSPEPQPGQAAPVQPAPANAEQYPPLPSFYQQAAAPDPYGAPANSYNAASAPGIPPMMPPPGYTYMPPPGTPPFVPPGAPMMPPGYGFAQQPGTPVMPPPGYGYMPPPGYGPMPAGYGMPPFMPPIQPSHPLPLGQAIRELPRQYWKILTRPGARAFAEEQGKAEWDIIWMQLLFLVLLALVVAFLNATSGITNVFTSLLSSGSTRSSIAITPLSTSFIVIEGIVLAILSPGFFLLGELIQFGLAKLFKGNGTYVQQAYNHLLFLVPIQVVSSFFSVLLSFSLRSFGSPVFSTTIIIALVLDLVVLGLLVYSIVLNVFSIMAAHRISGGRASGVVLIPYGIVFVLYIFLIFIAIFASLALVR